jgi:hypothetical protein
VWICIGGSTAIMSILGVGPITGAFVGLLHAWHRRFRKCRFGGHVCMSEVILIQRAQVEKRAMAQYASGT